MKQSITQKMAGRWRYLLFVCMFMLSTLSGFADHFRYGSLTWQRVPGNPLQVKFTLRNAFRLSLWTSQNLPVTIGGTIQTGNFKPGQGANIPAVYTVTAINVKDDWWYGECTAIKTYAASDTFNAFYNVCCRILNLENNSNATTVVPTLVQVGTANDNNDAPVVVTAPIVNFPKNKSLVSLKIPAVDPNGDAVTFSLAPNGSFGVPSLHPAGMAISNDGWLSWNTMGKTVGQIYNTSVKVTDAKGAYTYVDFLIKIVDSSAAPTFDYVASPPDGTTFNLQPGENITFHIKVSDPTTGDTVTLTAIGLPPGATFNTTGSNPVDGVFGWTPSPDQQGTYVVTFISQDTTGVQNTTTINFNIGYKPFFDIPTTPGNNSIFSVKPGDTLTHVIKAKSLDSTAKIALTMESGFIPGMTFTPSFPLTPANPVSTNFTWVPQMSDWGVKKVVYMAVDTFRHQPVYDTIHYVIDNPPVITSTPATTVNAGQTYTYILSATDMDIPVGDKLKVENITLPSFLSIVSNNNNTWTISGTPGAGDVGTYNIMIEVADSMNHKFGTHDGNAYQYIPLQVLNAPLTATGIVTDATIFGASTGAINITPTGGVGPYTYSWSNSATTEDLSSIPAGTYIVTITDANNSTFIDTFTVGQPAQLTVTGVVSHIAIFGGNNGAIDITPAGGVGPYTYVWNNNSTIEDRTSLTAGTYSVTVTDANGATATGTFTVNQPAQLTATGTATPATIYNTNTGSVNITPAGGVGPYTYNWSNGATTEDITGVGAGTYTVTITDANGATFTTTYTVSQPAQLTVSGVVSNVTIFGSNNGAINITPAGGVGPYTYVWSTTATTEDVNGLTAATYTVTVTDANGATATGTYTVSQPAQLTATGTATPATVYNTNTGSINITPAGGVGPYTYNWSNNATTEDLTGVGAGTYTVTITDANGATFTATYTVTQPTQLTVSGVVTNVTTYGGNNGAINITPAGGVGPYTYNWNNNSTIEDRTGLTAGTYTVTVTDANGATATGTYTVTQPANTTPLNATLTVSPVNTVPNHAPYTIYKGYGPQSVTLTASATGGTPGYTYSWSPSAGLSSPNSASTSASPSVTTTYTVTITDAANNTKTLSRTIYVIDVRCGNNPNNPKVLVCHRTLNCNHPWWYQCGSSCYDYHNICVSDNAVATHLSHGDYIGECMDVDGSVTNLVCNGGNNGAVNLSVTGGAAPYTYSWSNNATTEDISGLAAGTYTVTVTGADNRTMTKSFTVCQPSALNVTGNVSNACYNNNNGSINVSVSGGTAPYTYLWNNNATSQDRNNLTAGTYTVVVTDNKGCSVTKTFTVTQPSAPITLNASLTHVSCNGGENGAIDLSVTGGSAPYTYSWNLGGSNNNNSNCWNWWWWWCNNSCNNSSNNSSAQDVNSLEEGNYTVTVTDANGCSVTGTYTITEPAALSLSASVTNPTCANVNGGAINLSVNGGTSPYTYSWSNGSNWCNNNSNVTTQDRTGISGGTYSVKVTDAKGCTKTQSFSLSQPTNNISASISVSPTVTVTTGQSYTIYKGYGQQYVTLSASVSGGNSGYTFSWSPTTGVANPSSATTNVTPNATTTYTVTITSSTGCTKTVTKTIKVEDVRCGNNDEKVLVCRNGQTKCISQSQVSSYLCNGYQIGECDNNCKPGGEPENDEQGINSMVAKDIKVYPNPSNGVFTLELPAGTGNAQVIVTDMNGKIIDRKSVTESSVQFNLGGIAQGMYLIQVAAGSETYQSRITIK